MSCPSIKRYRSALTSRLCGSQSGIINSCMTNTMRRIEWPFVFFKTCLPKLTVIWHTTRGRSPIPKSSTYWQAKWKKVNQYRQLRYSLTKRQSRPRSHLFSYLVFFILWYNAHIYMHKVLYTEKLFIAILLSGQYFIAKSKLSVFHILIDYL